MPASENPRHRAAAIAFAAVGLRFGEREIFGEVSGEILPRARIAILGDNGTGKTTLLRLLAGQIAPDRGQISRAARVGFLPQNFAEISGKTLFDAVAAGDPAAKLLADFEKMTKNFRGDDPVFLENFAKIQEKIEAAGGFDLPARVDRALAAVGLGIPAGADFAPLSGGEKMRAGLARAILPRPEILLFDEPTRHLDAPGRRILGDFLEKFPGAVVAVSHDRGFLGKLFREFWEIDRGAIRVFSGSLEDFFVAREREKSAALAEKSRLDRACRGVRGDFEKVKTRGARVKKMGQTEPDKLIRRAREERGQITQSRARADFLAKKEKIATAAAEIFVPDEIKFRFEIPARSRARQKVLVDFAGVSIGIPGGREILWAVNFTLRTGEKISLKGPNGAGKSTLLRAIAGDPGLAVRGAAVRPAAGKIAFLTQDHRELDAKKTVRENFLTAASGVGDARARELLHDFGFRGPALDRPAGALSGGEKMRLGLARVAAAEPALVLLDEPTNDLDLRATTELEQVLRDFPGAMIAISHDEIFLTNLGVRRMVALRAGEIFG